MAQLERFQLKGKATCRIAYVEGLFTKRLPKGATEGTPKYNAIILVPKDDTEKIEQINAEYAKAFKALKDAGFSGKSAAAINEKNNCWIDGDVLADKEDNKERYRGYYLLKVASPSFRPMVFDTQKRIILNGVANPSVNAEDISPEELRSGDYVHASVSFWAYCKPTVAGIGCNPHAFIRVAEGEPFGGSGASTNADDYFNAEPYE